MYEHNALGYWSGLALCLTKVRSSRARCPATALIYFCRHIKSTRATTHSCKNWADSFWYPTKLPKTKKIKLYNMIILDGT